MANKHTEFDYRSKAVELKELVAALQNPDIEIDEATKLHSKGLKLLSELEAYLSQAEIVVKKHIAESE
jgi:exodeoxyribonuclease VII small subunit